MNETFRFFNCGKVLTKTSNTKILHFFKPGGKYGPSILVGEEMMGYLSHYDFKVVNNPLPFCRAALLCTMLTSKKHQDGLQRLIVKSDLDRMKGALKNKAMQVESLLKDGWTACEGKSLKHADKVASFGKLCVRLILHLLSKEKHSRDKAFQSFQDIVQQFTDDLSGGGISREAAAERQLASSGSQQRDAEVQDLHQASEQEIALLQHPHLRLGDLFFGCIGHMFLKKGASNFLLSRLFSSRCLHEVHSQRSW